MPTTAHKRLIYFIEAGGVPFRLLTHHVCRTSMESAAARAAAGAPNTKGAKALIIRTTAHGQFIMVVLPGDARLANETIRRLVGRFRFASLDEIAKITGGLQPGMIPPFIQPVFPELERLILDEQISQQPLIGFNAGHLEQSIVMTGADYLTLVNPEVIASISVTAAKV